MTNEDVSISHRGRLDRPDGAGVAGGGQCPDTISIQIQVRDDVITRLAFDSTGCQAALACGSMIAQLATGKHLDAAAETTGETVATALGGMTPQTRHVARIAAEALENAIWDYVIRAIERGEK